MTIDKNRLKALAEAAHADLCDWQPDFGLTEPQQAFSIQAGPATILALLGEIERLEKLPTAWTEVIDQSVELDELRDAQLEWLNERDRLKAENAQFKNQEIELRSGIDQAKADGAEVWGLAQGRADDIDRLKAENEALAHLLKRFVDGEYDDAEDQSDRHSYYGEAQAILARMSGDFQEYSLVPYEALWKQRTELVELRRDAERYRWLRDAENEVALMFGGHAWEGMSSEYMNQSIDAAMAKEQGHDC